MFITTKLLVMMKATVDQKKFRSGGSRVFELDICHLGFHSILDISIWWVGGVIALRFGRSS